VRILQIRDFMPYKNCQQNHIAFML
jgi:hypothetical protein